MKLRAPRRWWEWIGASVVAIAVAGSAISGWWMARYVRVVHRLTRGVGDTVFYAADGRPWFRLDEQRHDVPLFEIAADLQHAVVAVEDRRFYLHPGIDPIGVARAIVRNSLSDGRSEGGSTLTQQLARTLFLSNTKTLARKAKEASIAVLLEVQLSKDQILELYLTRIYLSACVYGVDAMAAHLFRKPAKALTLAEVALIAGLIKAPSTLSPWSNYEGALRRSHLVLGLMREQGYITAAQEQAARVERPRIQRCRSPQDPRRDGRKAGCASNFATSLAAITHPTGRCRRRSTAQRKTPPNRRLRVAFGGTRETTSRRRGLHTQHVQPRDTQPSPARLRLQADRLRGGARTRPLACEYARSSR